MLLSLHYPALNTWFPKEETFIELNHDYIKKLHFVGNSEIVEVILRTPITLPEAQQCRNFFDFVFSLFAGKKIASGQRFIITSDGKYYFINSDSPLIHYQRDLVVNYANLSFEVFKNQASNIFEQIDAKFNYLDSLIKSYLEKDVEQYFLSFTTNLIACHEGKIAPLPYFPFSLQDRVEQLVEATPDFILDKLKLAFEQNHLYLAKRKNNEHLAIKFEKESFDSVEKWLAATFWLLINDEDDESQSGIFANQTMERKSLQLVNFLQEQIILQILGLEITDKAYISSCQQFLDNLLFDKLNANFEKAIAEFEKIVEVKDKFLQFEE
ncbi:hypothetical protein [Lactobacillus psittaci]|uniref:Uncharacterized protein n=1 Tax=Lactobacillus psittaci DSM 15354 TaxID=1122152 RepID=A0A0R1SA52_9LACO|nr:hypothetical protein [Lactobacillus psittaci]KRL63610.1 hypothetical protein FC23_GL000518 [Lactobacillus psittaci DSM 15354]